MHFKYPRVSAVNRIATRTFRDKKKNNNNKADSFFRLNLNVYVVVQFYSWFKFCFPLFLGMVMYDNEFEIKEIKFKPRIKLNHNIYIDVDNKERAGA